MHSRSPQGASEVTAVSIGEGRMFGARHRRYLHGRDAHGRQVSFYLRPVHGEGVALYRRGGELLAVFPFLQVGALRAEAREVAAAASWPGDEVDGGLR
jgi:hypothetical protein